MIGLRGDAGIAKALRHRLRGPPAGAVDDTRPALVRGDECVTKSGCYGDLIREAQRITAHEGRRRQMQYIGKLMRRTDPEPLREAVAAMQLGHAKDALALHDAERWRAELIASDDALTEWTANRPQADVQQLRSLVRAARKDAAAVMIGSVLEEHLRQLCLRHEVQVADVKDGKPVWKVDLVKEGFDPMNAPDPLFVIDSAHETYLPIDASMHRRIVSGGLRL